jgi:hypothetical protein
MAQNTLARWTRRAWAMLLPALLLAPTGCVCLDCFNSRPGGPSKGDVYKVVATWIPRVVPSPDPTQNGALKPCLGARVFLFGQDLGAPLVADGPLIVDLFDPTQVDPTTGQAPKHLDRWVFDPDTLNQKLLKRDMWGWGYSLGCPWSNYRPDLTRVELRVSYEPKGGVILYGDTSSVTLISPEEAAVVKQTSAKH